MKRDGRGRNSNERFYALDSLRGIAALAVVLAHSMLMIPEASRNNTSVWIDYNPLRVFFNSHIAVLLFFVLSGFVLAIPYFQKRKQTYASFIIKRFFRIYPPFFFAVLLSCALFAGSSPVRDSLGSEAFRNWWPYGELNLPYVLHHLMMTGISREMMLDTPIWSLVYEMRVAVIFPALVLLCLKIRDCRWFLLLTCVVYFSAPFLAVNAGYDPGLNRLPTLESTFYAMQRFTPFFMLGIMLAKYNDGLRTWYAHRSKAFCRISAFLCFVIVYLPPDIELIAPRLYAVPYQYILEPLLGIVALYLIFAARNIAAFQKPLEHPALKWLGQISYSLYLIHLPIMLFMFRGLLGLYPLPVISMVTFLITLAAATMFNLLIERPSQRLGHNIAKRVQIAAGR